ncbi:hypothetical protein B296_00037363 [Ensete ventricosum]|uniref:Uncharacterized protein n=1 Tax=Ensete ventricosum TaxID=4639 RepID=A0A426X6C9_ENSVE|nr:hypothetical protein B296_00037363 [Ensete ventricosum]
MIWYQSRGRFEPDRKSDFMTELAQESGRLHELLRLGAVAALPQVGFLGSGLQVTSFAGTSSGELIGELPNCLDLASEAEESLGRDDERSRVGHCDSNEISVPESLIFFIAYHTTVSHHAVRDPCGRPYDR